MKIKVIVIAISFILIFAACSRLEAPKNAIGKTNDAVMTEISLQDVAMEEFSDFVNSNNISPLMVTHTYQLDGQEITGFLPINNNTALSTQSIQESWENAYATFVRDLAEEIEDEEASLKLLANSTNLIAPKFVPISVLGFTDESNIGKLEKLSNINSVKRINASPEETAPQLETQQFVYNWWPTSGRVTTAQSSPSSRYVLNFMTWTANNFPTDYGYEHDFRLNNYNGSSLPGTYFGRRANLQGHPLGIHYAATSWPSNSLPYLDTRFLDTGGYLGGPNEVAYTIGMVEANTITTNTEYYTYIVVEHGDANTDNAKLDAVLTKGQALFGCNTQWCMFQQSTARIFLAWNLPVPAPNNHWWF